MCLAVLGAAIELKYQGKLSSYVGVVPRVSNSNETGHPGRITVRGSKLRGGYWRSSLFAMFYNN